MNETLKQLTLLIIRGHSGGGDDSVVSPPPQDLSPCQYLSGENLP